MLNLVWLGTATLGFKPIRERVVQRLLGFAVVFLRSSIVHREPRPSTFTSPRIKMAVPSYKEIRRSPVLPLRGKAKALLRLIVMSALGS
jgi:hypothetical protein